MGALLPLEEGRQEVREPGPLPLGLPLGLGIKGTGGRGAAEQQACRSLHFRGSPQESGRLWGLHVWWRVSTWRGRDSRKGLSLAGVAQWAGALPCTPKGCGFDP